MRSSASGHSDEITDAGIVGQARDIDQVPGARDDSPDGPHRPDRCDPRRHVIEPRPGHRS
jgi:hypothetical protein